MKLCISTVALAAVLAFTAPAAAGEVSEFMDRFRLGNGCLPVPLVVEGLDKDATRIGLTGKAITITVRSRLRAARIYTEKRGAPQLHVAVSMAGPAYHVAVSLRKLVHDPGTRSFNVTPTWWIRYIGPHGNDAGAVLLRVWQLADEFIDEYLRVNALACKSEKL